MTEPTDFLLKYTEELQKDFDNFMEERAKQKNDDLKSNKIYFNPDKFTMRDLYQIQNELNGFDWSYEVTYNDDNFEFTELEDYHIKWLKNWRDTEHANKIRLQLVIK